MAMVIHILANFQERILTMKKVYLLGIILAASSAHFAPASANADGAVGIAAPTPGCPKAFQGFGLKGNVGYGVGWGKSKFTNNLTGFSHTTRKGVRGFDGGIGVDYTHRICNWALGIEFDANWASTEGKHSFRSATDVGSSKVRLKNSLQLLGNIGYVMREIAMPFVGLGWDNSKWKTSGSDNGFSGSKHKRLNSFLWRFGVNFLATRHVVLGAEYTGTIGNKVKFSSRNSVISGSFKPQYNKFALTAKIVY
jgi:opacity protein-like surface antigen